MNNATKISQVTLGGGLCAIAILLGLDGLIGLSIGQVFLALLLGGIGILLWCTIGQKN